MPGSIWDLLFGAGPLKKAAGTGDTTPAAPPPAATPQAPVIDMAAEAQKMVPKPAPAVPLPAAPVIKKKPTTATKVGTQLMGQ